jgi:hypothetical protein
MKGKAKPRSGGRPSKAAEELFLKATAEVFRTEFPTPEGSRRFDSNAVKAAVYRCHRERLPDDLVDEMTWCSETFADFERHFKEARFARRMKLVAVCLAVAVALAVALWWYLASSPW